MGYDGGFTKIGIKMENQSQVNKYYTEIRDKIREIIGRDNFFKFEKADIDLFVDNYWLEVQILSKICKLNNYERDECPCTIIPKSIFKIFIDKLKNIKLSDYFNISEDDILKELQYEITHDILLLERIYKEFNWENNTLVFSYSY